MRNKHSFRVALGGVISALSLVVLMMTGVIPFATYSLPCLAGLLLVVVVVECGAKWAWVSFAATAILSMMITPDREAAIMYTALFGYYPMVKQQIEKRFFGVKEWAYKLLLFNISVVIAYFIAINLLGMTYLLEDLGDSVALGLLALLGLGNIVFVLYDVAMTRMLSAYIFVFRKKLFKRFK